MDVNAQAKSAIPLMREIFLLGEKAYNENSVGFTDWARVLLSVASPLTSPLTDPSVAPLARLAAARSIVSVARNKMMNFLEDHRDAIDPVLVGQFDQAYWPLVDLNAKLLGLEGKWMNLPSTWIARAVETFYSGTWQTLERWGKGLADTLANPLGIPLAWIVGGAVVFIIVGFALYLTPKRP